MVRMDLHTYLLREDSPTATELARLVGVAPDVLRHWRHKHEGRKPSPPNARRLEEVTKGAVTRKELRPDDWRDHWPELAPKRKKTAHQE